MVDHIPANPNIRDAGDLPGVPRLKRPAPHQYWDAHCEPYCDPYCDPYCEMPVGNKN